MVTLAISSHKKKIRFLIQSNFNVAEEILSIYTLNHYELVIISIVVLSHQSL